MRKLLLAAFFLLSSLGLHAQTVPVTGNLKTVLGESLGSNTFVRFRLRNYKPNRPLVSGVGIIGQTTKDVSPDSNGLVSTTVYDNDFITPDGTFYTLEFYLQGRFVFAASYTITGASFDFNTAEPLSSVPMSAVPVAESRVFTHIQATPATTWTITHNFAVREVTLDFYDASFNRIFPDLVTLTDINTVTALFVVAQTGRVVVMRAENVNLTTSISDPVLKVPFTAQSISGGFDLTLDGNFLLATTGQNIGSPTVRPDAFLETVTTGVLNNIRKCDNPKYVGADAGLKIAACIADLPSTGGIADARGLEGAQTISSTITVNKTVQIQLGAATFTCSASPCIDFTGSGEGSQLIGVGISTTTGTEGSQLLAANGTISPMIRIEGVADGNRLSGILIKGITVKGVYTSTQVGLYVNFANIISLDDVFFLELGQAEDIDSVFAMHHRKVATFHVGSGGTAATAQVRVENRSGVAATENITWDQESRFVGDPSTGKHGTGLWVGANTSLIKLEGTKFDFNSANADFPIIHLEKVNEATFVSVSVAATTITAASGVIEITGDGGTRSGKVRFVDLAVSTSATVPAVWFDFSSGGQLIGGTLKGLGTGTAITVTANAQATRLMPFRMTGLTTLLDNSSSSTMTMMPSQDTAGVWEFPVGLALGVSPHADTGLLRCPNNANCIVARNAADGADVVLLLLNSDDDARIIADLRVNGRLGIGNVQPQATGIIMPNNEEIWMQAFGGSKQDTLRLDGSDVLQVGTGSGIASLNLGAAAVPTAIGGVLEYRDAPTLAASTTPSVTGGNVFLTNSTASITDFTGEQNGQVIILLCEADTTTSLVDSTPLFLSTAFTCTADDTITLVSNGTVWYETSRSVN